MAGSIPSDLTVTSIDEPSRLAPLSIEPPSDSTARAISVAERVVVPLVRSAEASELAPARPAGSVEAPPTATSDAVTIGRSRRSTVTTCSPFASRVSTGRGSTAAIGAAGAGGRTRCPAWAGVTTRMSAGARRSATRTVAATGTASLAAAAGFASTGR